MKPRDVSHEVVESVSGDAARAVEIDAAQTLHDVGVIRYLEIRHDGLAETLDLDVFAVVPADGHAVIYYIRDREHNFADRCGKLGFLRLKLGKTLGSGIDLCFCRLCLILLALLHQRADLLREAVAVRAKLVRLGLRTAALDVELDHAIDKLKLAILKLLLDVLLDDVRIFAQKFNVYHN